MQVGAVVAAPAERSQTLVGTLLSPRRAPLSPRVDGLVERVLVDAGDRVARGDQLARLDAKLADISVRTARAAVAEAEAERSDAQRQLAESARLLEKGHIPQTVHDSTAAQVAVREATVQRRESELARERELRQRHELVAPFAGVIVQRNIEAGQWVRADSAAFELVSLDPLRLEVPLPQRLFADVAVGQTVAVSFDAYPDATRSGRISARVPNALTSARTFPVWVEVPNPDRDLVPGMSARVSIDLGGAVVRHAVPSDALVRRPDGRVLVWRVEESAQGLVAKPIPVQPGAVSAGLTTIQGDALSIGDSVVVRGNESLRPDQPVRLRGAE